MEGSPVTVTTEYKFECDWTWDDPENGHILACAYSDYVSDRFDEAYVAGWRTRHDARGHHDLCPEHAEHAGVFNGVRLYG